MQATREILQILIAWPTAVIICVLALRSPIQKLVERLIKSESGRAKVGPVEIELGKLAEEGQRAVQTLNKLNLLMGESRLLELEITEGNFGAVFSTDQRERMKQHIEELKELTDEAANDAYLRQHSAGKCPLSSTNDRLVSTDSGISETDEDRVTSPS